MRRDAMLWQRLGRGGRLRFALYLLLALGLLGALVGLSAQRLLPESTALSPLLALPTAQASPTPVVAVPSAPIAAADPAGPLNADLNALIQTYQKQGVSVVGLLIKDGGSRLAVRINPDRQFVAASLYKLFVLWQTQIEIRQGRLSDETSLTLSAETDASAVDGYPLGAYGDTITVAEARRRMITVAEARRRMITASNNTAALLLQRIGWDAVGQPCATTALPSLRSARKPRRHHERLRSSSRGSSSKIWIRACRPATMP